MSRPLRIQYEGACYHVTNQGAKKKPIVTCDQHREMFTELLREIHELYQAEIHAWCLLDDCYHLLLVTPLANLSQVMRHLNGVYTQKFNRLENSDGALFSGRYKSILIDSNVYMLHVGRRIHLSPQEAKLVDDLSEYMWSSYCNYIGRVKPPRWLCMQQTRNLLRDYNDDYNEYFSSDEDPFVLDFYQKKSTGFILGNTDFVEQIKALQQDQHDSVKSAASVLSEDINTAVASELGLRLEDVFASKRGSVNVARLLSIYLHHVVAQMNHTKIAEVFKFKQAGSVGSSLYRYKKLKREQPGLQKTEQNIIQTLRGLSQ